MAIGTGDVLRTTVNFQLQNGVWYQNVYTHIYDGVGGMSDQAIVDDIETWAEAMYGELVTHVESQVVEQLSSVDQIEFVDGNWKVVANLGTFTPAFAPSGPTAILPNQISPFIVFKTARPQSVGRKFLFPVLETEQTGGIIAGGLITDLVAFADDAVNDVDLDLVDVLHPCIARVGVNDILVFTVAVVTDLLGTQRRRRPGYGA